MNKDKLDMLFEKQITLQKTLNSTPGRMTSEQHQQYINTMTIALIDELMEAIRETPWKPWKKTQSYNEEEFKQELVDAWHFLINLTLASGMDSKELFERFDNKNKINHERQRSGY